MPYLLYHIACLRKNHLFDDHSVNQQNKLSLQVNLHVSPEEETNLLLKMGRYQLYLYLFFRHFVIAYPSIPLNLIGKKNYQDGSYYAIVTDSRMIKSLYENVWTKTRHILHVDSSEKYNSSDELMVVAVKKELQQLQPYIFP